MIVAKRSGKLISARSAAKKQGWLKWVRTEADERALLAGCRFEESLGDHVAGFFRAYLRHSKGEWAGQPFELLDWQRDDIIYPIFGWVKPDGNRLFRKAYIEIPKKNGKSTIAAGVGLYMAVGDGEMGAEVYSAATDREQASIVHSEAIRMVESSPELAAELKVNQTTKNIAHHATGSWYRALTGEAENKEGLNAHCIIADELHIWKGWTLWNTLKFAGRARRQPLMFMITTAGEDVPGVCKSQHEYAEGVLKNEIHDERYFAYIRAADRNDDIHDPKVWYKANPSMGITITEEDMAADIKEAEASPSQMATLKRYLFNIWGQSASPWLDMTKWSACREEFTEDDLLGRRCYGGLDLSKTTDMTAFVLCFPCDEELYRFLAWFWLPEDTIFEARKTNPHLETWVKMGLLEATPGSVCDYAFIRRRVSELKDKFDIVDFAYDPHNAEETTQRIEDDFGIERFVFPQTIVNFNSPTKEFERLVISGKLRHNGNAIFTQQAGNTRVKTDANNNKRPVKPPDDDTRKIDGIVAAIMALGRALAAPAEDKCSVEVW